MFKTVAEWLKKDKTKLSDEQNPNELAGLVTALMVEAATADGQFGPEEQALILTVIAKQFEMTQDAAQSLLETVTKENQERIELHSVLRKLRDQADYEERLGVLEMVWMVVLSDGQLEKMEAQLMRRLAGLLFVSDVDSGLAAKTAKSRLGLA